MENNSENTTMSMSALKKQLDKIDMENLDIIRLIDEICYPVPKNRKQKGD